MKIRPPSCKVGPCKLCATALPPLTFTWPGWVWWRLQSLWAPVYVVTMCPPCVGLALACDDALKPDTSES